MTNDKVENFRMTPPKQQFEATSFRILNNVQFLGRCAVAVKVNDLDASLPDQHFPTFGWNGLK